MKGSDGIRVELKIPSEFGYEKVAMSTVGTIATEFGFNDDKVEDIKTAVSEACINAIEHGNKLQVDKSVYVSFKVDTNGMVIDVADEGGSDAFVLTSAPDLEHKLQPGEKKRGWGLFIIEKLVDNVELLKQGDDTSVLRMIIHFEQKNKA